MKKRILSLLVASTFLIGAQVTPAKAGSDTEVIGTLIGAAVGGFVGSNVGKGKGQLAATAIGVLLGAGIGNTMANSEQGITNTVYNPQPRVVYQPRPQPRYQPRPPARRVVYVERPKTRVVYIKQKPRTKYVVIKRYGPPRHAKAYGHKKRHWKKQRRTSRRTIYYSKGGYRTVRTVTTRRHRS